MCLRARMFISVVGRWSFANAVEKKRERLGPMLAACTILHHEYLRHKYINKRMRTGRSASDKREDCGRGWQL